MTTVQALTRCAGLTFLKGTAAQETSAQSVLMEVSERVTAFVESTAPGVVTLGLPSERPWQESDLEAQLVVPLRRLGWDVRVGMARNVEVALLAAQIGYKIGHKGYGGKVRCVQDVAAFMAPLPVRVLKPSAECAGILKAWGIETVGEFLKLPRAKVCEMLPGDEEGTDAVELWERASGTCRRAMDWAKGTEVYVERAELEHAVEMLEPLLFLLSRFLEQILNRLREIYLVPGRLTLELQFEQGEPYRNEFVIPEPTGEMEVLFRMLHTHLEGFTAEWPIVGVELSAEPVRASKEQADLFETGLRDGRRFTETLARVQAILGPDRVGSPRLEASHHPEAFKMAAYRVSEKAEKSGQPLQEMVDEAFVGVPWLRFRPTIAAEVVCEQGKPAYVSGQMGGRVCEARGPWLRGGEWWEENQAWSREEWDVRFETGMYRLVKGEGGRWFVVGVYL